MLNESYLMKKGNMYLSSVEKSEISDMAPRPRFSIYKYDAARVETRRMAKAVISRIMTKGEKWQVVRFNQLNGAEKVVSWTREAAQ